MPRLLLKCMEDINGIRKAHSIYCSKCVAIIVLNDLDNSGSLTLPRLRRGMFATILRGSQCKTNAPLNL